MACDLVRFGLYKIFSWPTAAKHEGAEFFQLPHQFEPGEVFAEGTCVHIVLTKFICFKSIFGFL